MKFLGLKFIKIYFIYVKTCTLNEFILKLCLKIIF